MKFAHRLDNVSESATLKLNALVQSLKKQGENVINLSAGEPDFSPPEEAKKAILEALQANRTKYTPVPGIPELRQKIADRTNKQQFSKNSEPHWKSENVIVTNGGKHAIFNTFLSLLNPGDEVLIPSPYWLSYPEIAKIAEAKPVFIETQLENDYKISAKDLARHLSAKTKLLILNSPSNPTGSVYTAEEFSELAKVLKDHPNVWVLSDEIYDRIVFNGSFVSFLSAAPELKDRCVTVNGLSKSGAITGWRVGWSVAPLSLTERMCTLQGQATSGINALAQWAGLALLGLPDDKFLATLEIYRRRRDLALEVLSKSSKIKYRTPMGAFYFFVDVRTEAFSFCEKFLQEKKVAVVPGTPFGASTCIRLSFATDDLSLKTGCERLVEYLG